MGCDASKHNVVYFYYDDYYEENVFYEPRYCPHGAIYWNYEDSYEVYGHCCNRTVRTIFAIIGPLFVVIMIIIFLVKALRAKRYR